jgi:polyphosphate kinase
LWPRVARNFGPYRGYFHVDRYLEHARIFYFQNCGEPVYLLASADLMPRNLDRRVEIAFPVLDPALQTP